MTSYYLGHVAEAEKRIREAVPDAIIQRTHNWSGLNVFNAAGTVGAVVFKPIEPTWLCEIRSSPADIERVIRVIGAKPAA